MISVLSIFNTNDKVFNRKYNIVTFFKYTLSYILCRQFYAYVALNISRTGAMQHRGVIVGESTRKSR